MWRLTASHCVFAEMRLDSAMFVPLPRRFPVLPRSPWRVVAFGAWKHKLSGMLCRTALYCAFAKSGPRIDNWELQEKNTGASCPRHLESATACRQARDSRTK